MKQAPRLIAARTRRAIFMLGALLLSACANHTPPGETIDFQSADYSFLSEPLVGNPGTERTVNGYLMLPGTTTGRAPYPAVIMLHSSWGRGEQEWGYSKQLLDRGIAVFAIDSFHPRGEYNTSADQSLVSETSMLQDAFSALNTLSSDPRFDRDHIGILGFSKGGIVALYSALQRINKSMAKDGNHFAAHIAYYPWCGIQMLDPQTTGMPILIQTGEEDTITPVALCQELASQLQQADSQSDIEVIAYENARHGFDHPMLKKLSWVPMGAQVPGNCHIKEVSELRFIEESTQEIVDATNIYQVMRRCGSFNGVAGGNPNAREVALQTMLSEFSIALLGTR
jgi:dienelactone hydrolase